MKSIYKLTDQEVLSLTKDQLETRIKYRIAEAGIKLVKEPKSPQYLDIPGPDLKVYYINTFSGICFTDLDKLNEFVSFLKENKEIICDYSYKVDYKVYKDALCNTKGLELEDFKISEIYSKGLFSKVEKDLIYNKDLKNKYTQQLEEYDNYMSQVKEISYPIYEYHQMIIDKYNILDSYVKMMNIEYLPLAGKNFDIAFAFLDKAYSLTQEQKEYVFDIFNQKLKKNV